MSPGAPSPHSSRARDPGIRAPNPHFPETHAPCGRPLSSRILGATWGRRPVRKREDGEGARESPGRLSSQVSGRVTASPPPPAPAFGAPIRSPWAPASPGPVPLRRLRRAAGPGHSPASRAVPRLRPGEKEGRARQESPAHTSAAGANRRPLRQATAPPMGDAPANQEDRLADRANQKLSECASRGKRTAPECGARRRGRGQDPRPDGQGTRPMASCGGRPGAGGPRDTGECAALCTRHEWEPL
uniref:proapoptotic nucleolar protein 1-like n=1 Tax=Odobenus rosmarus divergens TaxID=9708 RepID=UPI00063C8A00|nr:PREDICTED: proapoptotic nucleolar protein 1-like [Odobenus rosmarus divergens]